MMKNVRRRNAVIVGTLATMLAGCGGSQPPIGAPGAIPQNAAIATHADRAGSWMAPEAKSENLLYISDHFGPVYVFSYPTGKLVGQLDAGFMPDGLCSDRAGNVFVTYTADKRVLEFAHGGTSPIGTFSDRYIDFNPSDCSVDPVTGNLAVADLDSRGVVIWHQARGAPQVYIVPNGVMFYCAYDDKGNLFADQVRVHGRLKPTYIGELPAGSTTFKDIKLSKSMGAPIGIQWDGKYVAVDDGHTNTIYRVNFSGSIGTVISTVPLSGAKYIYQFWIQHRRLIGPDVIGSVGGVGFWKYPSGGPILKEIYGLFYLPVGATVSVSS